MKVLTIQELQDLKTAMANPKWKTLPKAHREYLTEQFNTSLNLLKNSNDLYYPLFNDQSRFLVLMGGGGSGKSVFAADKIIYRMRTEPGNKWLICRKVAADLRDSVFTELVNAIETLGYTEEFTIPKGRSSDLYLKHNKTGDECLFYGLDDVGKRKSIQGITNTWLEEASDLEVQDFRQLNIRMRHPSPSYNQMLISFNPVSSTHWLKSEFFDRGGIVI
jgi:phage terminase large subunit